MTDSVANRYTGAFLGLALGDACGAPHEGGPLERVLWTLIGTRNGKQRFTDDTQMSIDLAESLLEFGHINGDDLAQRFCRSYRWDRGYGPGTVRVLTRIRRGMPWDQAASSVFHGGSYGNGGAMRAPIVALCFAAAGDDAVSEAARASAAVTHAHPLAQEGAELIALATTWALEGRGVDETIRALSGRSPSADFIRRLDSAGELLADPGAVSERVIRQRLGNRTAATESCVTAIYLAQAFRDQPFEALLRTAIGLRGDVDTIAAMAGAIWGGFNGADALPGDRLARLEQCDRIRRLALMLTPAKNVKT